AALCVPALGGKGDCEGKTDAHLGAAEPAAGLSDAARGRAAGCTSGDAALNGIMGGTVMTDLKSRSFRVLRRFLARQEGATAIEYAMIAAGVGATIASTVWGVGSVLRANWYDKL